MQLFQKRGVRNLVEKVFKSSGKALGILPGIKGGKPVDITNNLLSFYLYLWIHAVIVIIYSFAQHSP